MPYGVRVPLGLFDEVMTDLFHAGATHQRIGDLFGIRKETVGRRLRRHGVRGPRDGSARGAGWRGGRTVRKDGYIAAYAPEHPNASMTGHVLEHRLVMSDHLGRPLKVSETVHHRNGNRQDNRIENLELWVGNHGRGASAPHCDSCTCFPES